MRRKGGVRGGFGCDTGGTGMRYSQPGDLRSRYWRTEGAQVDFDPTRPYTFHMSIRERLLRDPDRYEAIAFRRWLPKFRLWQKQFSIT